MNNLDTYFNEMKQLVKKTALHLAEPEKSSAEDILTILHDFLISFQVPMIIIW